MKIIVFFFRNSRKTVLLSVVAGAVSGACTAALLAVINAVLKTKTPVSPLIWSFAGLCLLLPVARLVSERLLNRLAQQTMYELRIQLCRQILAAPLRHLEQLGAARLLAALTDDIPAIVNTVAFLPLIFVNTALVVGCLVYMGLLWWVLLAIVLLFLAVGVAGYQLPIIRVRNIFRLARQQADLLQGHLRALIYGIKELKLHDERRSAFLKDGLEATAGAMRQHNTAGLNLYTAAGSWGQVLVFLVIGLMLFAFPRLHAVSTPMLAAYTLTLLYLMTPLQMIMNTLPQLTRANVALGAVKSLGFSLAAEPPEEMARNGFASAEWKTLEFLAVTHAYRREGESSDFVLGPVDLLFQTGEMVFITGGNGSGKTTLIKLLTGLYLPESGRITIDGRPVTAENKETYRQYFSVVFADFYLFDDMLGLARPELDQQVRGYLDQLQLSHKVRVASGKLSTTELSQGQRKRLALLTAFLEDRPVYVFDEWAADQDPYFKNIFYTQLLPQLKARNKTVFVISHDDRYYFVADRVIKLDDGQIASDIRKESALEISTPQTA